jgi:D-glycero-alpha-D-manno-heptose 1-phosphate guanylyltransferase
MKSSVHSAVILAGGLGTRLRSVVAEVPKPMAPVNGRPFLEHQMDYWIDQGIARFILSVGYRWEVISAHFGSSYHGASVDYAVETEPQGTGGGLLLALNQLTNAAPFLLLNGDTFFEVQLPDLVAFHTQCASEWTFSLFRTSEVGRYLGLDVADDGRLSSMRANNESKKSRLVNGGVYLVNPGVLLRHEWNRSSRLSLEEDIFPVLMRDGTRFFGQECRGCFIDIGVPEDYLRSAEILSVGRVSE